ncbi:MAG: NAD(P)-dependent oxidoreductase [Dysosmobacter sp.]
MKNVIITGVGGFLGGALAKKLLLDGYTVYGITSSGHVGELIEYPNFHSVQADFESYHKLRDFLPKIEFDVFYHFAWKGVSGADYKNIEVQEKNIIASRKALQTAIELKCGKFIYVGSSHSYLKDKMSKDMSYAECSIYGAAKKTGEIWCKAIARNQIKFNSILFTNVFGVGDTSKRSTNIFLSKLLNNEDLDLVQGDNLHDWTYVDDAIKGIECVVDRGINGKQYYIGSRKMRKFSAILTEVRDIVAPNSKLNFGQYKDNSFIDYSCIDLNALFEDTGFECTSDFKESIQKTVEWVRHLKI